MYTIYKATNAVNGKAYVGFDSKWPARQKAHKFAETNGYFHCAIRKHGFNNFSWEILYQSLDGDHCLSVMEPHFIAEHDTFNSGYNMTLGGEGRLGQIVSDETRAKMSAAGKGRIMSDETREKMSAASKGHIVSDETREKIGAAKQNMSVETRAKIGAAHKGKIVSAESRAKMRDAKQNMSVETRAKMSAAGKGKIVSAETRAKISAFHKARQLSSLKHNVVQEMLN